MSGVETETSELERVEDWRRLRLLQGGFDAEAAATLAICFDVDVREAVRLIRAGCPQKVALAILL